MNEPIWLTEARKYIGEREIKGTENNPKILRWWTSIRAPFSDDETPWCAAFVGGVLESVGIKSSRSAAARSYMRWGESVEPCLGAVVVFWRNSPTSSSGHVAFLVGKDTHGNLFCLGGNQGDIVKVSVFSKERVLGYRFPRGVNPGNHPLPILNYRGELSRNEQ